ncbi:MAG: MBL fold metallo-hydrolase [bacterium JZ-2024 1]
MLGYFYLDGGAMFGVVPKVLWEPLYPADEKNRIQLGFNVLLIQTPREKILIDNGIGSKISPRIREIYSVHWEGFSALPFPSESIDYVVLTHLHFDHCGGSTEFRGDSPEPFPSFSHATYFLQKEEWDFAGNLNERTRASYFPENYLPLQQHGVLSLVKGEQEIISSCRVIPTPGHTPGHQICVFYTSERPVAFLGDLVPTTRHIPLPYIMAYDLYPLTTLQTRKEIYQRAIEENWLLVFEHDDHPHAGTLRKTDDRYTLDLLY